MKATWEDRKKLENTRWKIETDDGVWFHIRDTKLNIHTDVWFASFWEAIDFLVRSWPEDFV